MEAIRSLHNPKVQLVRRLGQRKYRDKEKKFAVEGVRMVEEALEAGVRFYELFYNSWLFRTDRGRALYETLTGKGHTPILVSDQVLSAITDTESPQGIVAVVEIPLYDPDEMFRAEIPLVVVVDGLQDPGNLGTIIRTAVGAGVSGVVMTHGSVDVYSPKTLRSTMGAVFRMPLVRIQHLRGIKPWLGSHGIRLVAGHPRAATPYFECDFRLPTAIVLGNEDSGLTGEIINLVDELVTIPILGPVESLNVAVAAGVLIYEAVRQRSVL